MYEAKDVQQLNTSGVKPVCWVVVAVNAHVIAVDASHSMYNHQVNLNPLIIGIMLAITNIKLNDSKNLIGYDLGSVWLPPDQNL